METHVLRLFEWPRYSRPTGTTKGQFTIPSFSGLRRICLEIIVGEDPVCNSEEKVADGVDHFDEKVVDEGEQSDKQDRDEAGEFAEDVSDFEAVVMVFGAVPEKGSSDNVKCFFVSNNANNNDSFVSAFFVALSAARWPAGRLAV